jgi:hypothetical protein
MIGATEQIQCMPVSWSHQTKEKKKRVDKKTARGADTWRTCLSEHATSTPTTFCPFLSFSLSFIVVVVSPFLSLLW